MHRPWRSDLACIECEDEWERRRWRRNIALAPIALIALLVGIGLVFVPIVLADVQAGGLGVIVVVFGVPIAVAMWVVRQVSRRTFRRRFMCEPATRMPRSRVVSRAKDAPKS